MRHRQDGSYRERGGRRPSVDRGRPERGGGPAQRPSGPKSGIDPFDLFCAYHLAIAPDKSYRPANIHDVARRFGVDAGVIRQTLQEYGMDPETMLDTDFDLTMAQMDIQVAPPGVDRVELAKGIFEAFRKAPRKKRDWQRILSDDERENAKIFGRKK
ncbi:MAG TPA: hypothetical protein VMN77_09880 [Nitrospiria bacterium]|nr:hypothetical protein [Nitrospiria bacterium]